MINRIQLIASVVSIVIIFVVIYLVKNKKLKESYSLIWLATGAFMLTASFWRRLLKIISDLIGIYYPPSALFLIGIIFLILLLLQFSVVISSLFENNKKLIQRVSLLEFELEELKKKLN